MAWKADKRNQALYGLFFFGEGRIFGETEHSFSMNLSANRVGVYRHPKGRRDLKRGKQAGHWPKTVKTDEGETVTLTGYCWFRLTKKNCPIEISFDERRAMMAKTLAWNKYVFRNVPFAVKKIVLPGLNPAVAGVE